MRRLPGSLRCSPRSWSTVSSGRRPRASVLPWVAAVATGLLGSAIPFLLYTFAVARIPAARTGVPLNLIPVFGVASSVVLLNEHLVTAQLLGAGLVLVGLCAAQLGTTEGAAAIESTPRAG